MGSSTSALKIADFGLSNLIQDGEFLQTSCGSPNYAAPEVIDGKYYSGEEIDVWSSGVILYALLTARLPFDDDYIPHLFSKIKRGKFKMPSFLSGPCQDLIRSMLVVDPLRRITIPEIKNHPWFVQDLPAYLRDFPEDNIDPHEMFQPSNLDETILQELQHMYNMSRSKLLSALNAEVEASASAAATAAALAQQSASVGAATPSPLDEPLTRCNPLMVAYLLLYDQAENDLSPAVAIRRHQQQSASSASVRNSYKDHSIAQSLAQLSTSPPMNLRDEIPFLDAAGTDLNVLAAMNAAPTSTGATTSGSFQHHVDYSIPMLSSAAFASDQTSTNPANSRTPSAYHDPSPLDMRGARGNGAANNSGSGAGVFSQVSFGGSLSNSNNQVPNIRASDGVEEGTGAEKTGAQQIQGVRKPWYLGILSRDTPNSIMKEVFRALKKLNFEWKIISPYQIHARALQPKTLVASHSSSSINFTSSTGSLGGPNSSQGTSSRSSLNKSGAVGHSGSFNPHHHQGAPNSRSSPKTPARTATSRVEVPGVSESPSSERGMRMRYDASSAAHDDLSLAEPLPLRMANATTAFGGVGDTSHSPSVPPYVKLMIQLFKVNPRKQEQAMVHLLDIKKLQGEPIAFFDLCSTFMSELQL